MQNCYDFYPQHSGDSHGILHPHKMEYTLWVSKVSHICNIKTSFQTFYIHIVAKWKLSQALVVSET